MPQAIAESAPENRCGRVGVPGTISNTGRPTLFSDAVVDEILRRLGDGETLTAPRTRSTGRSS